MASVSAGIPFPARAWYGMIDGLTAPQADRNYVGSISPCWLVSNTPVKHSIILRPYSTHRSPLYAFEGEDGHTFAAI